MTDTQCHDRNVCAFQRFAAETADKAQAQGRPLADVAAEDLLWLDVVRGDVFDEIRAGAQTLATRGEADELVRLVLLPAGTCAAVDAEGAAALADAPPPVVTYDAEDRHRCCGEHFADQHAAGCVNA